MGPVHSSPRQVWVHIYRPRPTISGEIHISRDRFAPDGICSSSCDASACTSKCRPEQLTQTRRCGAPLVGHTNVSSGRSGLAKATALDTSTNGTRKAHGVLSD